MIRISPMQLILAWLVVAAVVFSAPLLMYGADFFRLGYRIAHKRGQTSIFSHPQPNWIRSWFQWCALRGVALGERRARLDALKAKTDNQ